MQPPQWPNNWLDWLMLVGAVAGIVSATKLFASSLWLNKFQRTALVAAEQSCTKDIHLIKAMGGLVVFHLGTKDNKGQIPNDFYAYINKVNGETIGQSRANLTYLDELVKKELFIYIVEESGIKNMRNESYAITAKGIRFARVLRLFIHPSEHADKSTLSHNDKTKVSDKK